MSRAHSEEGGWRLDVERQRETGLEPSSPVDVPPEAGRLVDLLPEDSEHDGHLRVRPPSSMIEGWRDQDGGSPQQ